MVPGKAIAQTIVGGTPDFDGETHSSTFSAGGPGRLVDCMKCEKCGWSTTPVEETNVTDNTKEEGGDPTFTYTDIKAALEWVNTHAFKNKESSDAND